MSRRVEFLQYRPKTILNKSKRSDHWFWTRYSAYPYKGCQHGCEFCYCREQKYSPYTNPTDFAYIIKIKENAPDLLRSSLLRVPVDPIFTGDYQPAERKFKISRKMLEVCYDLGFPVFVLERSPLVIRDLDLLKSIHLRARTTVAFSIISAPGSPYYENIQRIERLAPTSEKRFIAMEKFALAGIPTGVCFMPILPGLCDTETNLSNVIRWTADHGGQFILASTLTLADQQRNYLFNFLGEHIPDFLVQYNHIFPVGSYSPANYNWHNLALRIRELCTKMGLKDRIPRPIIPGEKRSLNKRVVEALANQIYTMELETAPDSQIWSYRKAAWAIEDIEQDIGLVYRTMGLKGLESISSIEPSLAKVVEQLILYFRA